MSERLQKQILVQGTGEQVPVGSTAVVHYTGKFEKNGVVFDSSVSRGQPFSFVVGAGNVILGWDACLKSMKKGEKCLLRCPPEYAYGERGAPPLIGPNETLIFEIELLAIQ
jgi:FK506-binding protein 4/5